VRAFRVMVPASVAIRVPGNHLESGALRGFRGGMTRIVRDYPLSSRADDAKSRLEDLEIPVPKPDASAWHVRNLSRRIIIALVSWAVACG